MTLTPDRELEELDFPTPDVEESVDHLDFEPTPRLVVGPITFTPATEVPFICWDCDKEFDGPTGRCPSCAEVFGKQRMTAIAPASREEMEAEEAFRRHMLAAQHRRYVAQYRDYQDRGGYCYCSPSRSQRLSRSFSPVEEFGPQATLARDMARALAADMAALQARPQAPAGGRRVSGKMCLVCSTVSMGVGSVLGMLLAFVG